jgi:hypothetical protein
VAPRGARVRPKMVDCYELNPELGAVRQALACGGLTSI